MALVSFGSPRTVDIQPTYRPQFCLERAKAMGAPEPGGDQWRAYWLTRTVAECVTVGAPVPTLCADGWYVPG